MKSRKRVMKYPDGGELTGGPGDPKKPVTVEEWNALKQKYAGSLPKGKTGGNALDKRMDWVQWADKALPTSGTPAQLSKKAAQATGFNNPGLLLSSSMEEGVGLRYKTDGDAYSEAYDMAKIDQKAFPVDGFRTYGLDQIGGRVDEFINKGYLPKDFKNKMKAFNASNEIDDRDYYTEALTLGQKKGLLDKNLKFKMNDFDLYDKVDAAFKDYKGGDLPKRKTSANTAAFVDDESAFMAKAAFMRAEQDNVLGYAKQKGYKLTPEEQSFFTLASYNGGAGNGQKMLDYYGGKKLLGNNGFLKERMADKGQIYDNILPRYAGANLFNNEGYFKMGGKIEKYPDGGEIDPITGQPVNELKKAPGQKSAFDMAMDTPVPINPDAPQNQQIFRLQDNKGTVAPESPVVPLSQFYDKVNDNLGNTHLQGTGKYVNALGGVNTMADQQAEADIISAANLDNANKWESNLDKAEMYASTGMTAINAFFNKKNAAQEGRKNARKAILDENFAPQVNPYLEGTGSQAIFEKGGKMEGDSIGIQTLGGGKAELISSSDHSNPMVEFKGREHKDGGIGIAYGGKIAEVEDKEVGFIDAEGGLNIFGKMKIPGSNMTFKKAAKNIAEQEQKIDGMKSKYLNVLTNSNPADKYQETANSTAKVMFKSLDKQSKEIAEKKEAMASYQELVLNLTGKDKEDKMAYGGKMPKKIYAEGGKLDPNDPKSVQAIIDKYSDGKSPLKAEDFIEVSNKYGVPLDLMLAQAIQESNIGTKGMAVRTNNIFNVGNNGNTGKTTKQQDFKAGLERYAKLIKDEYSDNGVIDVKKLLDTNFKRPKKGGNYAEESDYAKNVARVMNEINPGNNYASNYTSSEDPYPKNFKGFISKDGKTYKAPEGLNPSVFYKNPEVVKALKDDKTFPKADADAVWGIEHDKVWNSLPQSTKDSIIKGSQTPAIKSLDNNVTNGTSTDYTTGFDRKYVPLGNSDKAFETPYGMANKIPADFSDNVNLGKGESKRGFISPLAIEQIAPELLTVATNRRDPVYQQSYQPELKQTFDLSYQLGRNENQSTFNQVAQIAESTGNVDALSALAAQKYKADEQYNMQEVQGNATQKLQTYNQNVDTLNDARLKNLALIADQQVKQAQAKFNTRKEDLSAFTSVAGKVLQNNLENKTYNAYANLFKHYGFDKKGNVTFIPDEVVTKFTPGEAAQFGMLSAKNGADAIMKGDYSRQFTRVKNSDGSTTTTEKLGNNKQIQEKYKALKAQGFDDGIIGNMLRAEFPETISQD